MGDDLLCDVNGDDDLTPVDALIVVNSIAKGTAATERPAADVDGNGWIDDADAVLVLEALASESRTSTPSAAAPERAHAPLTAMVLSGPSGSTSSSGPSGSTVVSGPSGSTTVSGPSGSTVVSGPSGSTTVSGPSGSTAPSGPSDPAPPTAGSGPSSPSFPSSPSGPADPTDPPPPSGPVTRLGDRVCGDRAPSPWTEQARPTIAGKGTAVWTVGDTPVNSAADIPWVDNGPLYVRSPAFPDDGWGDDSQLGNLTVLKYRQYYVGQTKQGKTVDNPDPNNKKPVVIRESAISESVSSQTTGFSESVDLEIGAELRDLGASLNLSSSMSITFTERRRDASEQDRNIEYEIPTCTVLSVYDIWLVTEVEYYWEYWEDTLVGDFPPGFTEHRGIATARSNVWMATGEVRVSNSVMRPVYRGDVLIEYKVVETHPPVATPRLYD